MMARQLEDSSDIRAELRTLCRSSLLVIAERTAELLPADQLSSLLGDFVKVEAASCEAPLPVAALLDDVRKFVDAAMAGHYYETVEIKNRCRQEQFTGTDAFVVEFDRLVRRCTHVANDEEFVEVLTSVELLLALLRQIDEGNDDVLFFVDEGGSSAIGVNWRAVLLTYFKC